MLIPDWRRIAKHAWSVRFAVLAAAFSALEMALPVFFTSIPQHTFLALAFFATLGGLLSRFVAQPKLHDD